MKRFVAILLMMGVLSAVSACREEGTMEKAGREVDEAVDRLQHGDEGALEKAGRRIDETVDEAMEEAEKEREESK